MFAVKKSSDVFSGNDVAKLVYADQMDLLYRSLTISMFASIGLAALWLLLMASLTNSPWPVWWFTAVVLVSVLRMINAVAFRRYRLRHDCHFWEVLFIAGVIFSASLWAVAVAWIFPLLDVAHQALMVLFLAGLHMGALSTAAARPLPMPIFVVISILPMMWHWFGEYNQLPNATLIMFALYIMVIGGNARRLYNTTRKSIELGHESKRSEQRFRDIVDSAGDALLVMDVTGHVVDVNKTAMKLTGYDRESLLGKLLSDISLIAEDRFQRLLKQLEGGMVRMEETEFRAPEGKQIPVNVSASLYSLRGEVYVVMVVHDLTHQKRQDQELKLSRDKLGLHIKQTHMGVIDWDTNFCVTAWNPAAEKIFGFSENEILGRSAYETIVPTMAKEMVSDVWRRLIEHPGVHHSINENIRRDKTSIICDWNNTTLQDDDGQVLGVASMVMDVTGQVEAQKALVNAKTHAEEANRSKTKFLSRMSHELRTPLNAIIGFSSLLRKDGNRQDFIDAIETSGHHLLSMINEILDLARLEQGKLNLHLSEVSLSQIVREAMLAVMPMAEKEAIRINVCQNCGVLTVVADHNCLRQVLVNLLSNAVKYSGDGKEINIRAEEKGERIRLEVQDFGLGIAKDKHHLLFKEFERAGAEATNIGGTGIGLMISRHMMEEMGGEIGFISEEGKGSRFWLTVPRSGSVEK